MESSVFRDAAVVVSTEDRGVASGEASDRHEAVASAAVFNVFLRLDCLRIDRRVCIPVEALPELLWSSAEAIRYGI